jgi:hypothetical protein
MSGLFDDAEIEIPCYCGRKTKKTVGWIKNHSQFTCACGTVISLKSDEFVPYYFPYSGFCSFYFWKIESPSA